MTVKARGWECHFSAAVLAPKDYNVSQEVVTSAIEE